jgi:hypothetical protein
VFGVENTIENSEKGATGYGRHGNASTDWSVVRESEALS